MSCITKQIILNLSSAAQCPYTAVPGEVSIICNCIGVCQCAVGATTGRPQNKCIRLPSMWYGVCDCTLSGYRLH